MDFTMGLPNRKNKNDSTFVVVDKFYKVAHFILVNSTYKVVHNADIFLKEIFRLHGIPKEIIFDRDTKLLWRETSYGLGEHNRQLDMRNQSFPNMK